MRPIKLLVADDEVIVRRYIAAVVQNEGLPVASVCFAANGLEAVFQALVESPDLVIMDIRMPGVDGLEALRLIRRNDPSIAAAVIAAESAWKDLADDNPPPIRLAKPVGAKAISGLVNRVAGLPPPVRQCTEATALIRSVLELIERDLAGPLTLAGLARHFSTSPQYLSRVFTEITGHTLKAHIQCRRIAKAALLLSESNRPISDVAHMCGFHSQRYFATCFKAHKGHRPLEYRNSQ